MPQERRPTKRLFSLTAAGREQLGVFAAEPTRRPTAIRDEFLIKMQAMDGVDPRAVRALVEERRAWALGKLARYERMRERLLDGRTEEEHLRDAGRVGPYLTLAAGIAFERENARWCERVLTVLSERRAPAEPGGQALG